MTTATLNPFAPGFVDDPYSQYARLRVDDPVHRSDLLFGWVVTRFDDVGRILRDTSMSSNVRHATPTAATRIELEVLAEAPRAGETVVLMDDPDHARVRKLMADPFRPREIEKLAARITERIDRAFDDLRADHGGGRVELDLVGELAYPLPVEIFSEMLGLPEEDHPRFRELSGLVARTPDPVMSTEERAHCVAALDEMCAYLEAAVEEKRQRPTGDLLSELVHAHADGDSLSHTELVAQLVTLYMAGHEPVTSLIGAGTVALLRHPDQLARLRSDRSLLRNAVSELLRYDGPNQFVRRITTRPTTIGDVELPSGEVVYASVASANRDPARWGDTAEAVVVDRSDAGQHLQFGAGVHACLGSHLARLQAEIAFAAILDRLDDLALAGEPTWNARMFIRGIDRLPVACTITEGAR
jgi:cytochrome P450